MRLTIQQVGGLYEPFSAFIACYSAMIALLLSYSTLSYHIICCPVLSYTLFFFFFSYPLLGISIIFYFIFYFVYLDHFCSMSTYPLLLPLRYAIITRFLSHHSSFITHHLSPNSLLPLLSYHLICYQLLIRIFFHLFSANFLAFFLSHLIPSQFVVVAVMSTLLLRVRAVLLPGIPCHI